MNHVEWYNSRHFGASYSLFLLLLDVADRCDHEDAIWIKTHFGDRSTHDSCTSVVAMLCQLRCTDDRAACWIREMVGGGVSEDVYKSLKIAADNGHAFSAVFMAYYTQPDSYRDALCKIGTGDPECLYNAASYNIRKGNLTNARSYLIQSICTGFSEYIDIRLFRAVFPEERTRLFWIGKSFSWNVAFRNYLWDTNADVNMMLTHQKKLACYNFWKETCDAYLNSTIAWLLVGKCVGCHRNIIPVIGRLVWNSRSEAECYFVQPQPEEHMSFIPIQK